MNTSHVFRVSEINDCRTFQWMVMLVCPRQRNKSISIIASCSFTLLCKTAFKLNNGICVQSIFLSVWMKSRTLLSCEEDGAVMEARKAAWRLISVWQDLRGRMPPTGLSSSMRENTPDNQISDCLTTTLTLESKLMSPFKNVQLFKE